METHRFFDLPQELQDMVYAHLIVSPSTILLGRSIKHHHLTTSILYSPSRKMREHAAEIFYSRNTFDLSKITVPRLRALLQTIGAANCAHIKHIRIPFPFLQQLVLGPPDKATGNPVFDMLDVVAEYCGNITTITTDMISSHDAEVELSGLPTRDDIAEVLEAVNTHFNAFRRRNEVKFTVKIELYAGDSAHNHAMRLVREEMMRLNWELELRVDAELCFLQWLLDVVDF